MFCKNIIPKGMIVLGAIATLVLALTACESSSSNGDLASTSVSCTDIPSMLASLSRKLDSDTKVYNTAKANESPEESDDRNAVDTDNDNIATLLKKQSDQDQCPSAPTPSSTPTSSAASTSSPTPMSKPTPKPSSKATRLSAVEHVVSVTCNITTDVIVGGDDKVKCTVSAHNGSTVTIHPEITRGNDNATWSNASPCSSDTCEFHLKGKGIGTFDLKVTATADGNKAGVFEQPDVEVKESGVFK
jgi:hypothetical protein